jgi:2-desacetyl-2-hydroxyethyl bacteriochlorophyllide A dehydrogenase
MQQIILRSPGNFAERDVEQPSAGPGEALVRMERIGVCGSDFHAFAGKHPAYVYPRVLGHELACTVVFAPPNEFGISEGDRCAIDPYVNCGECRTCRMGRTNCCERLEVLGVHRDGGMQDRMAVPLRLLHRSANLSLEELALVETLGIGAHAVKRGGIEKGETALVVGAGPIGLGTALFAREAGAEVTLVETNEVRRAFGEHLGWKTIASWGEIMADVVFDATGSASVMAESLNHVAAGGKLVFVGLTSDPIALDDSLFHKREVTLFSSRNSANQFPRIIRLLEEGKITVQDWVTDRLSLSELPKEFAGLQTRPKLIKAVVEVQPRVTRNGEG